MSIEISSSELSRLLRAVMPLAAGDHSLPVINSVLIQSQGGYLTATATDRYRLGIMRTKVDNLPADFRILASLRDLRQVLTVFKAPRKSDLTLRLSVGEDAGKPTFSVEAVGSLTTFTEARLTYRQVEGDFPKVGNIAQMALTAPVPDGNELWVNANLLADFKAIATAVGERHGTIRIRFGTRHKPFIVAIGDDFIGAQMPDVSTDKPFYNADSWAPLLPTPSEKPADAKESAA